MAANFGRILWLAGLSAGLSIAPAAAETVIEGSHPVCNSAEQIDDAVRSFELDDTEWFERLKGCYLLEPGQRIERVGGGFLWWGICKATIGFGKTVWTPCANIVDE